MSVKLPDVLPINDLYPYEVSVTQGGFKKWLKKLNEKEKLTAIKVLEVDGKYLVVNGNHRVMAAKAFGLCVIPVKWEHKSYQEMAPYRDALNEHLSYKGYEDFPLTLSSETRRKEILQEMKNIAPNTLENFLNKLQIKENDGDDGEDSLGEIKK